ncbi:hypothetical protein GYMLUDRAFT_1029287 [Collybiopsis luxurians FD-317 M1]|uniref:DNA topoisomerase (ATP-hydrolyzing) n=1 Tax=Collybiopsis luxurians FD-317 M1 TaxID=944289 RepID=A0A0D0CBF8_9AGAR|nr:hypothetical protein GYMLUDRAFT_1029287 [Collybiopsis luxurians FD-317 M1]
MSSSEGKNFGMNDISDSKSDNYRPAPKKTTKPKTTKVAAALKTKVATTKMTGKSKVVAKKVLVDHNDNADEDAVDEDKRREIDDGVPLMKEDLAPTKKEKIVSDTYQKTITQMMWTYNADSRHMVHYEILVNAADNKINDSNMDTLKVTIEINEGIISVYNNRKGIPIEIHNTKKIYIPELIFNHLSGSNYDDDEKKKLTSIHNDYGAKLANIYSHEFTIETPDKNTSQNMSKCRKAKITKNSKSEEFTHVTFCPDLKQFSMDLIDNNTAGLLHKHIYNMADTVKDIKVFFNDEHLKVKNLKSYVELYLNSVSAEAAEYCNFMQVSFANSISTTKDQIAKNLITAIRRKNKAATAKAGQIKNYIQTKEMLMLPASKFGTKLVLSDDFMKKVQKSPIVENILNWAKFKADQQIKKTDGSKCSQLTGLLKLSDANNAGTKDSKDCMLILTKGDSAQALAIAGLGAVGCNNFGEARHNQIMKNEEIQNIKKIMGLQHNKDYSNVSSLCYRQLMIMTNHDHNGSHIKGLLINFLDHFYPSLLKVPDFLVEFVMPIVWVLKGKQRKDFFTISEYEHADKWESKYFKGLGTSTDADAHGYFSDMAKHLIELAFSKKKVDNQKEWLQQFKPSTFLDHQLKEIPYSEFVNKELILFSMADNVRSIPSVADGLKPGQRKIIWACFKRNLKKEIKLDSNNCCTHSRFISSNNLNLMFPSGQFGMRDQHGKDHTLGRYSNTLPMSIAQTIFHPDDDPLLNPQYNNNQLIEPEFYMAVVPMVLINGAEGIGTGWSTNIPSFNPINIILNIQCLMNNEELVPMHLWWQGFKAKIKQTAKNKYDVSGVITKLNDTTVEITELLIHKWTQTFKGELEAMMTSGEKMNGSVKNYQEHHANENIHFVVQMDAKEVAKAEEKGLLEYFKLISKVSTSSMICFDLDGKIQKYESPEAILEEFYPSQLSYYQKQKIIVNKKLSLNVQKKANIVMDLKAHKFIPIPKKAKVAATLNMAEAEDEDKEDDVGESTSTSDYDCLLNMPIYSLTKEKQTEIMVLPKKSPKDMWNVDLDKFLADPASTMAMMSSQTVIPGENQHGKDLNVIISNSMPKYWLHGGQNGTGVMNSFNGTDNNNCMNSYAQIIISKPSLLPLETWSALRGYPVLMTGWKGCQEGSGD